MIANLEPGLHNLSSEIYHADPCPKPSLSNGIANILLTQSPAHAWLAHPRLNPNYVRETDSRFDLGSAVHALLLERDESRIVRVQAADWRTNAAKQARADAQANGMYAVLDHQYADMERMAEKARLYLPTTELGNILDTGSAEESLIWQENGLWCRARPDLISADRSVCLDYKSTDSAHPDVFGRQIGRMGYDTQAEFYTAGFEALGERVTFIFLVQEISPPYACSLVALSNAYREVGQLKVERALRTWERCTSENRWPAYDTRILYIEPSSYQLADLEHS